MIIDRIENRAAYAFLGDGFRQALDFLAGYQPCNAKREDIALDGDRVFVKVRPMKTKPLEECSLEAHRHYADIHYVAKGREQIGYANIHQLEQIGYDEDKDMVKLAGPSDPITLAEGYFMITFPEDAHMPCITIGQPQELTKLIAKVQL